MSLDSAVSLVFLVGRVVHYVAIIRLTLEPAEVFTRNGGNVGKRLEMIITADHIFCPFTQNRTLTSIVWPFTWSTVHFHQVKNEPDILNQEMLPVGSVINNALKSYAACGHVLTNLSDDKIHDMEEHLESHSFDEFNMAKLRSQNCWCDVRQSWTLLLTAGIFLIVDAFYAYRLTSQFYRRYGAASSCLCKRCAEHRIESYLKRTNREKFVRNRLTYSLVASLIWTLMTSACLAFRLSWPYEYWTPDSLVVQKYFDIPSSWAIALFFALSVSVCFALEIGLLQCLNAGGLGEDPVSDELQVGDVRHDAGDWCCCRRASTTLRDTDDIFPSKCVHHAKCLEEERLRKRLAEKEAFDRRLKQSLTFRDTDQIKQYKNPGWLSKHRKQPSIEEVQEWSVISFPSYIKSRMKFCCSNPLSQRFEATYP